MEDIKYRDAHLKQAHAAKASGPNFILERDYCAVWTSIDRKCPSDFARCLDWEDSNDSSECSNLDADLEVQDRQKQQSENKQTAETLLRRPKTLPVVLTYQTSKPPAGWPNENKRKAVEPEHEYTNSRINLVRNKIYPK